MEPEILTIINNKKEKLVGLFHKNNSKTIIIICHGIESSNNFHIPTVRDAYRRYLAELFRVTQICVFSFDFSGYGESEGKLEVNLRQRDSEIKSVLDYFSQEYDEIILYGFSFGGISSAIASAKYKEIKKLITINGFFTFNPKELYWSNLFAFMSYLFLHPKFWIDLFFWMKNLKVEAIRVPSLVAISQKDPFVKTQQSINFYKKLKTDKKFVVIPCNDHAMVKDNYILAKEIAEWLKNME